jgi:hypothetical protein
MFHGLDCAERYMAHWMVVIFMSKLILEIKVRGSPPNISALSAFYGQAILEDGRPVGGDARATENYCSSHRAIVIYFEAIKRQLISTGEFARLSAGIFRFRLPDGRDSGVDGDRPFH